MIKDIRCNYDKLTKGVSDEIKALYDRRSTSRFNWLNIILIMITIALSIIGFLIGKTVP
jgi:hypothetical protein